MNSLDNGTVMCAFRTDQLLPLDFLSFVLRTLFTVTPDATLQHASRDSESLTTSLTDRMSFPVRRCAVLRPVYKTSPVFA